MHKKHQLLPAGPAVSGLGSEAGGIPQPHFVLRFLRHHPGFHPDLGHQALMDGGKWFIGGGDGALVPERNRGKEIGPVLEVTFDGLPCFRIVDQHITSAFHIHLQRLFEHDGVLDVPFVSRYPGILTVPLPDGDSGVQIGVEAQVPGVGQIILKPRPYESWLLLTVDIEVIVRFAEPARHRAVKADDGPDILAVSLDIEQGVISERNNRPFLVVAGMKIERIGRELIQFNPVDIEIT